METDIKTNNSEIQELISELNRIDLPYKEQIINNSDVMAQLLIEAKRTGQKPNIRRYLADTKIEYNDSGYTPETEKRINQRYEDFNNAESEIFNSKYLYYDVEGMESIKAIKEIGENADKLTYFTDKKNFDKKILYESILDSLNTLNSTVSKFVIEQLTAYKEDLSIVEYLGYDTEETKFLRKGLNLFLKENHKQKPQQQPQQGKPQQPNEIIDLKEYKGIAKDLSDHIQGADDTIIAHIKKYHCIPEGEKKPKWIGSPANAHRFRLWCDKKTNGRDMTEKPMRDCFEGLEKDIFYRSIVPTDKDDKEIFEETAGTIYDILKKYPKP